MTTSGTTRHETRTRCGAWGRIPPRYEVVRCLGQGGMSCVYLAYDRETDRRVALKFLDSLDAGLRERFRREARIVARLDDPSIVRIDDTGEFEGRAYIALQYVDGGNLADAALGRRDLLRVMRSVASALRHAHDHGIVHRDVKPENILLDRAGHAIVTDFGIARDRLGCSGPTVSLDGQVVGTPHYMSPEQARGDLDLVDERSDIFSFGATLYHKLTGTPPFVGESMVDVLHAVIHRPPVRPRALAADLPRSLESIVMRCLAKRRRDRYPDMRSLLGNLDEVLAGHALLTTRAGLFARAAGRLRTVLKSWSVRRTVIYADTSR